MDHGQWLTPDVWWNPHGGSPGVLAGPPMVTRTGGWATHTPPTISRMPAWRQFFAVCRCLLACASPARVPKAPVTGSL
jgi:hypothetical protein